MSADFVQALCQFDRYSPGIDDCRRGDVVHRRISLLVRTSQLDALGFQRLRERVQVLHFKTHVIDGPSGRRDVSDGLVSFPPEEVEAVSYARQVRADEEVGLPRTQS